MEVGEETVKGLPLCKGCSSGTVCALSMCVCPNNLPKYIVKSSKDLKRFDGVRTSIFCPLAFQSSKTCKFCSPVSGTYETLSSGSLELMAIRPALCPLTTSAEDLDD